MEYAVWPKTCGFWVDRFVDGYCHVVVVVVLFGWEGSVRLLSTSSPSR